MSVSSLLRPEEWLDHEEPAFREALWKAGRRRAIPAGTRLYEHEGFGGMIGLTSGCIEVIVSFDCAPVSALHLAYPGQFMGNRPIVTGAGYAVSANARLDCEVVDLDLRALRDLVDRNERWLLSLARLTDHWFDVALCAALDLTLRDARARCIATLLRLGGYRPYAVLDTRSRLVPVTQGELADCANLSRSSVTATLADLDAAGLIERQYAGIHVIDPVGLDALVAAESA